MPHAAVNGANLWYELIGEGGEPMAILGGSLWARKNLDPVLPILRKHYTLLSFDPRGYGQSNSTGIESTTIETWADDTVGLMSTVGWDKAHINGTSFGGTIALAIGVRHPDRCLSVIAAGCSAKADAERRRRYESWIDAAREVGMGRELLAKMGELRGEPNFVGDFPDLVEQSLEMSAGTPLETWIAANRALQQVDLSEELPNCNVPTLVIAGELDELTPLHQKPPGLGMQQTVDLLPNARLVVFEGAGHGTVFERTEQHAQEIIDFTGSLHP